jgi:RHS repeat-associated protein
VGSGATPRVQSNKSFENIDRLSYLYNGNQLMEVTDASQSPAGYTDNNTNGHDFSYDANGNMYSDMDKSIHIAYNPLNLPQEVKSDRSAERLTYVYTATGAKLASLQHVEGGELVRGSRYVGPLVCEYRAETERWDVEYASVPEGRLVPRSGGWVPQFALKDHLGNVRALIEPSATTPPQMVWQQPGYYPFGMALGSTFSASEPNRTMYNGKEKQDYTLNDLELGWYDYGARFYDPQVGRWHSVDPQAERYSSMSPYVYVANNPMLFIDPNGEEIWIHYRDENDQVQKIQYTPGQNYEGDNNFVSTAWGALDKINSKDEGSSLISDLHKSSFEVGINETKGENIAIFKGSAFQNEDGTRGNGSNVSIEWNPNDTEGPLDINGNTYTPTFVSLAHELGHGKDAVNGTMIKDSDKYGVSWADVSACHTENKVRSENKIPLREYYKVIEVVDTKGNFLRYKGAGPLIFKGRNIHTKEKY